MRTYRVGIIGHGGFGKFLHHSWAKLANVEVTAIADLNVQGEIAHCKTYRDWRDLVNSKSIKPKARFTANACNRSYRT